MSLLEQDYGYNLRDRPTLWYQRRLKMDLFVFKDAVGFLDKVQLWLEQREVENNLMLGIALLLQKAPDYYKTQPFMGIVIETGGPVNAALMTPPFNLVLAGQSHSASLETLARGLIEQGWTLPGVLGPSETSCAFAGLWSRMNGIRVQPGMRMRIYELTRVIQPAWPAGRFRPAGMGDLALITDWVVAFRQEALNQSAALEAARRQAERLVAEQKAFLWDHDSPVSMAASTRPIRNGVSVNMVYTPPDQRQKGYASACVAALSQQLLDSGYKYCCLFTDLANPTSNRIYMDIGYLSVCDFNEYRFVDTATACCPDSTD
jgi:predicted GNAT family acetyltransferase